MSDFRKPRGREGGYRRDDRDRHERDSRPPLQSPPTPAVAFFDSNGKILPELFDTEAEKWARLFQGVPRSQLRQIFEEAKRYDGKEEDKPWDEVLPLARMIRSKTAYRAARQNIAQYRNVSDFVAKCLQLVKTRKDYHVFCLFFEAVYGFYYQFGGTEGGGR